MTGRGQGQGGTGTREDAAKVPRPIAAGPEMRALGRFYRDFTWKGVIHAGGMGPGTPAMTGVGRGAVPPGDPELKMPLTKTARSPRSR